VTAAGPAAGSGGCRIVVIGVGNQFRRDDGAGPEVVARLSGRLPPGVGLLVSDGEPAALIEAWTGADVAMVVDIMLGDGSGAGRLHRIVPGQSGWPQERPVSSHGLGLAQAIGLATALGRMPGRLIVHAVEAADVGHGHQLTPVVAAAIGALAAAVERDVAAALAAGGPIR
jgi:hydrogenase maturation protease